MAQLVSKGRPETNLSWEGETRVALDGPCMKPTFQNGQVVRVIPVNRVVSGMVGLISTRRGYLLHRIFKVIPPFLPEGNTLTDSRRTETVASV